MLPTFLVIGAKKAGTTSLFNYLLAHPDVWLPSAKRLDFLSGPNWDKGVDWYAQQFAPAGRAAARGEVSNTYSQHPVISGVAARAASIVPDARLVYLVRHPVDRIASHFRQALAEWHEQRPVDDVVFGDDYLALSRYAMQLDQWLEHYPRHQLLVVTAEDLRDHRQETLRQVLSFIGVDPGALPGPPDREFNRAGDYRSAGTVVDRLRADRRYRRVRNAIPAGVRRSAWRLATRPLPPEVRDWVLPASTRSALVDALRPDLRRLPDVLGDDFHCWGLLDDNGSGHS